MKTKINLLAFFLLTTTVFATSDVFPPSAPMPTVSDFLPQLINVYYCATDGDNLTGDGSIENPWLDLRGAAGIVAGDLIYFRGGLYPFAGETWSDGSMNSIAVNGTSANRIVITNYPGEVVYFSHDSVSITLRGGYQVLLGTMVSDSMGIQIDGGASIDNGADYCQISGVYIKRGMEYGSNPALFSYPHNTSLLLNLTISHCHFDSSEHNNAGGQGDRMVCIRLFTTRNTIIEYNKFTNCTELYQGGAIYFKDATEDAIIRYNKFINCEGGIAYSVQGNAFNGLDAYENLSYNSTYFIYFTSDLGDEDDINIFNNVILSLTSGFFYYLNADNQSWTEHGSIYNNVIDGTCLIQGWHSNSSDTQNLPDTLDYNLWYDTGDRNTPSGWSLPVNYYAHAVTSNNAVTYDPVNETCTVSDDYAGITSGRYSDCIGGFTWGITENNRSANNSHDYFQLNQNYPNPFNPSTTIKYTLEKPELVDINIYNQLGQLVRTLVNEEKGRGTYNAVWNGTNDQGISVASSIYIYQLRAGSFVQKKKMILLR